MDAKDAYIEQLENTIKKLQQQVENLTEMILILRKGKFGPSSEKTPKNYIEGQLSLFNEAEACAAFPEPEPITREVKGYTRTDARTKRVEIIKDLQELQKSLESCDQRIRVERVRLAFGTLLLVQGCRLWLVQQSMWLSEWGFFLQSEAL